MNGNYLKTIGKRIEIIGMHQTNVGNIGTHIEKDLSPNNRIDEWAMLGGWGGS